MTEAGKSYRASHDLPEDAVLTAVQYYDEPDGWRAEIEGDSVWIEERGHPSKDALIEHLKSAGVTAAAK